MEVSTGAGAGPVSALTLFLGLAFLVGAGVALTLFIVAEYGYCPLPDQDAVACPPIAIFGFVGVACAVIAPY